MRGLEDLENAEAFRTIGAGGTTFLAARQKMFTFRAQGLGFRHGHGFGFCLAGGGDLAVGPGQILAVEEQLLVPGAGVVKDGNAVGADNS